LPKTFSLEVTPKLKIIIFFQTNLKIFFAGIIFHFLLDIHLQIMRSLIIPINILLNQTWHIWTSQNGLKKHEL